MAECDFFHFCTSLAPVQLRELGRVSRVRHEPAGSVIFAAGDRAREFFVVNRGIITLSRNAPGDGPTGREIYLSRGELLGVHEVLLDAPREHHAVTCQAASLQVFPAGSLDALGPKLPSFARFLAEQLARQLLQTNRQARLSDAGTNLRGDLADFDLVTLLQTLQHSGQDGELQILDPRSQVIARVHLRQGVPERAGFFHLRGLAAIDELFLADDLAGEFRFRRTDRHSKETGKLPERSAESLLLDCLHKRDEYLHLREQSPLPKAGFLRGQVPPPAPGDAADPAPAVWDALGETPKTLAQLFRALPFDSATLYRALLALIRAGAAAAAPAKS